jgi:phosphoribosyl 1,2-cyclic phosphodiesterase
MSNGSLSGLTVRFRGVRGSIPAPGEKTGRYGGNTSCVEVRTAGHVLILDAGTGIRQLGCDLKREFGARPIKASLLISHSHWDHIQGLPFFAPAFEEANEIRVLAPPGHGPALQRALHNQMQPLHFPIGLAAMCGLRPVKELSFGEATLDPFHIRTIELNHPGGCAGFRVQVKGASLAYLPDHEPLSHWNERGDAASQTRTDALIQFIYGVDLLILDTQYTAAEYPAKVGWGHGFLPDSIRLALAANVKRLVLFHHEPTREDDEIDAMVAEGRRLASSSSLNVSAAAENGSILLGGCRTSIPTGRRIDSAAA